MDDAKGKVEYPAMGVSVRGQYAAGREVVFQLHFPMDVTAEGISRQGLSTVNASMSLEKMEAP